MTQPRRRIVVTGRHGQVASALLDRAAVNADLDIIPLGRPELDLSDSGSIGPSVAAARPEIIVSAAAYTSIEQAEADEGLATLVNQTSAGVLGQVAAALGVPIIHLSTACVFDGTRSGGYAETDTVAPLSVYGRSKLGGERAIAYATADHAILRTAWVFSPFGSNFLKTMLRIAEGRDCVNVIADEFGTPTSAFDIADAILSVARNLLASDEPGLRGTFHMSGSGQTSWAGFAEEIFRASRARGGPFAAVNPIPSYTYSSAVERPANAELDCRKLKAMHGVAMPGWRPATERVIERLFNTMQEATPMKERHS
ncbi:dTDP-4-dehydrorhamnose reductase [Rhizobium sp. PP-F2F-G36]|nr:dTDP-4-dehydrorhamnose reductase [Rhizobium sp. PP-CC-2G-626]TCQ05343.1 dTDP-4-dehydrorhamnose reductase [Rhizobium sp. PP-F2F-G36]